ncbi:TPA: glycosyltransferase family 2 protein [Photobacterium damselae]
MSKTKKFSVIIPLYNKSNYIINTLKSIIKQTYEGYEVIIYDDGSTDNSYQIVRDFIFEKGLESKIKLLTGPNVGVSEARNIAINNAKYAYCIFLDADDIIIDDNYFEIAEQIITHNNIDILGFNFYPNISDIPELYNDSYIDYFELYVKYGPPFCASSVIIRTDLCDNIFPKGEWLGEDLYAWASLISSGATVYFKNINAIEYIVDNNGAMTRKKDLIKLLKNELDIQSIYYDKFIEHHKNDYLRSCLYFYDKSSARDFLSRESYFKFIKYRVMLFFPTAIYKFIRFVKSYL